MGLFKFIKKLKEDKNKNKSASDIVNFDMKPDPTPYEKPHLPILTQEEIDDIHSRGKITPAEMLEEWEDMDLCAPGNAISSAGYRCKKFHYNCHDCLIDYASQNKEYTSFFDFFETASPYKIDSVEDAPKVKKKTDVKVNGR